MNAAVRFRRIVTPVVRWYGRHGRTLPWRGISNPYRIVLSEVMLQQTQVSRVLVKYPEFLRQFPSLRSLARAEVRDVIIAWRGMGYNNRAVRLHAMARILVKDHGERLPDDAGSLTRLPGIGRYTAHALLSSVHRIPVPVVDVNVRRFLSRVFFRMRSLDEMRSEREIWTIAESILPSRRTYDWNQALMDVGATVCTAREPACERCPVAHVCFSRRGMARVRTAGRKREPGLEGIPNRIYRGRIVEELRRYRGTRSIPVVDLGRRIYPSFSPKNGVWLRMLLTGLERDGLIVTKRGRGRRSRARVSLT